jgi:hypothetical protein
MIKRVPILLAVLFVAGCGHSPTLLGSWQAQFKNISAILDFRSDGTLTGKGSFRELKVDVKGKYTYDGHQLSYNITSAEPEDSTSNPFLLAAAANAKAFSDSGHLEWKNENEFILTNKRGILIPFERLRGNGGE